MWLPGTQSTAAAAFGLATPIPHSTPSHVVTLSDLTNEEVTYFRNTHLAVLQLNLVVAEFKDYVTEAIGQTESEDLDWQQKMGRFATRIDGIAALIYRIDPPERLWETHLACVAFAGYASNVARTIKDTLDNDIPPSAYIQPDMAIARSFRICQTYMAQFIVVDAAE